MTGSAHSATPDEVPPELLFRSRPVSVNDLLDLAEASALDATESAADEPVFYWEHPSADEAWLAVGSVADFVGAGAERLERVRVAARAVLARALPAPGEIAAPRVVGGFAFAPEAAASARWGEFPAAWFFLPRRLWLRQGNRCKFVECLTPAARLDYSKRSAARMDLQPDETNQSWLERVERALQRIDAGELEKVVLSRTRTLDGICPRLLPVLRRLRGTRPECVTFACKPAATTYFGSTPELMVERLEGLFVSPALAGTSRRTGDDERDRELAQALLACPKNRREHAAVVDGIRAALQALGVRLEPPQEPHVLALPEALHLRTPIFGRGAEEHDVLALAAALHPTAAVSGTPRAAAAALLRDAEPDRGWYTGGIGWMDASGDGEVVVTLRSGLLAGGSLSLFAGAGIVAGSNPRAELEETEIKMSAILSSLRAASSGTVRRGGRGRNAGLEVVRA